MTLTVGLIALAGHFLLDLPIGAAILLGAVLAPTDPVLASDVQVEDAGDRDRLRFGLTGEAGLNDGTAFPFVMLGLGLLGLHPLGEGGWRWLAVDVVWAIVGGLVIGYLCGLAVGRLVVFLRREHKEAVGLDEFLTLGLIALSYGVALFAHSYGFLAVFAAGLALRRTERAAVGEDAPLDVKAAAAAEGGEEEIATDPEHAPTYMTNAVLSFNEQLERIGEVALVLLVGGLLTKSLLPREALWFVPLLFLVIRPVSVGFGLFGARMSRAQRRLTSWFGIRGIGSIYYLMFAVTHGLPEPLARPLIGITLTTIAASIVVHGISVTPLMNRYAVRGPHGHGGGGAQVQDGDANK
jgi:NhaP-type Na+/H+ or K+/H+ antiporter